MNGTLTRLDKTELSGKTRTTSIHGSFSIVPTEGEVFSIIGKPIDPEANMRVWTTSVVKHVSKDYYRGDAVKFITKSGSVYELVFED